MCLHVTARPDVLADRLAARGRESAQDIARRLSRPAPAFPEGLPVTEIDNSGRLRRTRWSTRLPALYPARAVAMDQVEPPLRILAHQAEAVDRPGARQHGVEVARKRAARA